MMNYHKSTVIEIPDWGKAEIDNKMIPLILELNKMGLKTRQCCQGDGQYSRYVTLDRKGLLIESRSDDGGRMEPSLSNGRIL